MSIGTRCIPLLSPLVTHISDRMSELVQRGAIVPLLLCLLHVLYTRGWEPWGTRLPGRALVSAKLLFARVPTTTAIPVRATSALVPRTTTALVSPVKTPPLITIIAPALPAVGATRLRASSTRPLVRTALATSPRAMLFQPLAVRGGVAICLVHVAPGPIAGGGLESGLQALVPPVWEVNLLALSGCGARGRVCWWNPFSNRRTSLVRVCIVPNTCHLCQSFGNRHWTGVAQLLSDLLRRHLSNGHGVSIRGVYYPLLVGSVQHKLDRLLKRLVLEPGQ